MITITAPKDGCVQFVHSCIPGSKGCILYKLIGIGVVTCLLMENYKIEYHCTPNKDGSSLKLVMPHVTPNLLETKIVYLKVVRQDTCAPAPYLHRPNIQTPGADILVGVVRRRWRLRVADIHVHMHVQRDP